MKKINIICVLLVMVFFSSCLDEDPKYTINSKVIYEDEQSAQLALNGIYGFMAAQGTFSQIIPEICASGSGIGWAAFNPSNNDHQLINGTLPTESVLANYAWNGLYKVIANCNIFIESCDESNAQWLSKKNMVGQAKFMRAVCYFYLYNFFGPVPLRLTPSNRDNIMLGRATRQATLDQMIKDWAEASEVLSETSALTNGKPTAPSRYAAYAYLTKLYWLMGCNSWAAEQGDKWGTDILRPSWPEMKSSQEYFRTAKTYGDMVLARGSYDLEPDFRTLFGGKTEAGGERLPFSKEFILVIDATSNTTNNVGYHSLSYTFSPSNSSAGETWARIQPSKSFYDWAHGTYQDDPRLNVTFCSRYVSFVNNMPTDKYSIAYPLVGKTIVDTIGWKDTTLIVAGRPFPTKYPIMKTTNIIVDSIDYKNFTKYKDPCNPAIDELDSLIKAQYGKTKGPSDWNISDWAYFGKYMSRDISGRYGNNNLYIYRFADFLLLMADVENELGNTGGAQLLVNRVLKRARQSAKKTATYPKDWVGLGQEEVREKIFDERLYELAIEFDMFSDSRRRGIRWRQRLLERNNNHPLTRTCYEYGIENSYAAYWREYMFPEDHVNASGSVWDTFLIRNQLMPIPQPELSSNGAITLKDQNPGY